MSNQDPPRRESDIDQLLGMLSHAAAPAGHQKLDVSTVSAEDCTVAIHTGPDDSMAVFDFDAQGALRIVSVRVPVSYASAPEPAEPMTQLAESAAQTHELFTAYMDSGFTRAEALQIVIGVIAAGLRPQR